MNQIKKRKKESQYLLWISKIINEDLTNVNISYPNVIDVRLSNDGSHLKIYMSFGKNEQRSLEFLNSSKGFIRSELAKYGSNRKVPTLTFLIDEVQKNSQNIENILNEINKKRNEDE